MGRGLGCLVVVARKCHVEGVAGKARDIEDACKFVGRYSPLGRLGGARRGTFARRFDGVRVHYADVWAVYGVEADLGAVLGVGVDLEPSRAFGVDGLDDLRILL